MSTLAIIQARLGSSRMPKKVLAELGGVPVLKHLIDRAYAVPLIDEVVVATTVNVIDDAIVTWCSENKTNVYRGHEKDVLSRFFHCATQFGADTVVRLTADDPLKDPTLISTALELFFSESSDYVSNNLLETFAEGMDVEVIGYKAMRKAHLNAKKESEREHVTPYIKNRPDLFRLTNFESDQNWADLRLTLDYPCDLEVMELVLSHFEPGSFPSHQELCQFLMDFPAVRALNSHIIRNEGMLQSIQKE